MNKLFHEKCDPGYKYAVVEIKDNCLIVESESVYRTVPFVKNNETITFESIDKWIVEKDYVPANTSVEVKRSFTSKLESVGTSTQQIKGRKIRAVGSTAGAINRNNRLYTIEATKMAVNDWKMKMKDSSGQGRLVQSPSLLGEVEHPDDKGNYRPLLNEVAIKWTAIDFNETNNQVELEGNILNNPCGNQLVTLIENGIPIGISHRAEGIYFETPEGLQVVTSFSIKGYDAVLEPADSNASITDLLESFDKKKMTKDKIVALIKQYPALFANIDVTSITTEQEANMIEKVMREAVKIGENTDLEAQLKKLSEVDALKLELDIKSDSISDSALTDTIKDKKFKTFDEYTAFKTVFVEANEAAKAKERLKMTNIQVGKPVIERDLGIPEYASGSVKFREALMAKGDSAFKSMKHASELTGNVADVTKKLLNAYDKKNQRFLAAETASLNEAEQTSDLALPYTVVRNVIAEWFPKSVAATIFEVGVTNNSVARFFLSTYTPETGYLVAVAATAFTGFATTFVPAAIGASKDLPFLAANVVVPRNILPGSVVFSAGGVEGTDYQIDYYNGTVKTLTVTFASLPGTTTLAYSYKSIRKGELSSISTSKMALSTIDMTTRASRLGVKFSDESVRFANSDVGYDVVAMGIKNIADDMARQLDQQMFYMALTSALGIASNSTIYSKAIAIDNVAAGLTYAAGQARLKLENRFYPTDQSAFVVSTDIAEAMSQANMMSQLNVRLDTTLNGGVVGEWKGMRTYKTTEFGKLAVGNIAANPEWAMVVNKELVQYKVFENIALNGPAPIYEAATANLLSGKQYFMEMYDAMACLVPNKGSVIKITP